MITISSSTFGTNKFLTSPNSRIWFYLIALGAVYLYFLEAAGLLTKFFIYREKNADLGTFLLLRKITVFWIGI